MASGAVRISNGENELVILYALKRFLVRPSLVEKLHRMHWNQWAEIKY